MANETKVPFTVEEAFVAAMRQIGPIAKAQTNEAQGYKFRGIDDVLAEVNSALTDNGLFYLPNVVTYEREWRVSAKGTDMVHVFLTVRYDFYCEAGGGPLSMTIPTEGRDASDKATNKAMSGALKYGLIQCFAIPVRDQDDQDHTTPESHGPARSSSAPEATPAKLEPFPLDEVPKDATPLVWTKKVAAVVTEGDADMAKEWWRDAMILNDLMAPDDTLDSVDKLTEKDALAVAEILRDHAVDHKAEQEANDEAAVGSVPGY